MSSPVLSDSLAFEILAVVSEIPEGRVATYGQIARLIGREKNARRPFWQVGSQFSGPEGSAIDGGRRV